MVTGTTESLHLDPQVGDRDGRLGMVPDLKSQSPSLWQTFNKAVFPNSLTNGNKVFKPRSLWGHSDLCQQRDNDINYIQELNIWKCADSCHTRIREPEILFFATVSQLRLQVICPQVCKIIALDMFQYLLVSLQKRESFSLFEMWNKYLILFVLLLK